MLLKKIDEVLELVVKVVGLADGLLKEIADATCLLLSSRFFLLDLLLFDRGIVVVLFSQLGHLVLLLLQCGNGARLDSRVVEQPLGQEVYGVARLSLVEDSKTLCDDETEVVSLDIRRIGVLFGFGGSCSLFGFGGSCSRHVLIRHSLFFNYI